MELAILHENIFHFFFAFANACNANGMKCEEKTKLCWKKICGNRIYANDSVALKMTDLILWMSCKKI